MINEGAPTKPAQPGATNRVADYLCKDANNGLFNFRTFAASEGIVLPDAGWALVLAHYEQDHAQLQALKEAHGVAQLAEWNDLWWRVFRAAQSKVNGPPTGLFETLEGELAKKKDV